MPEPRVIEIIESYKKGNLQLVYEYLTQPDMIVDPSTWAGKIKDLIENEYYNTAKQLIERVSYKFLNK